MKLKLLAALILLIAAIMLLSPARAQSVTETTPPLNTGFSINDPLPTPIGKDIIIDQGRWKITRNHLATGGLVFLAGMAKGFNETLQFHWKEFHRQFPKANAGWFYPVESWKNKYKNDDPDAGPKYFLSTSVLIMFTDQYHLNNFFNKLAWGSAIVIKIGEGKKPFKQYVYDFLYYALCHQAGFALTYYPFSKYRGK